MKTQKNLLATNLHAYISGLLFLMGIVSIDCYAQTITNVYPTRVTDGVTVTIEGTGFTNATRNSIQFRTGGMNAINKQLINGSVMTFDIGRNATSNNLDPTQPHPNDISRELQVEIGGVLTNTNVYIDYVAPTAMIQAVNNFEGRIPIPANKRVQEIYTDYGSLKTYNDGDPFNSTDFNPSNFGRWEFFNLNFTANPSGVLVEAGGEGRGMFIGFVGGNFVARGGDGRPPATPVPPGTARLVLPASTFANKQGRLLVTMDPRVGSGELKLEWDENDDGIVDLIATETAAAGYLGYDQGATEFREWSGGNAGFVGNSNGNLAGKELTGGYNFNGTIGSMTFSNSKTKPIAWRSSQGTYSGQPANQRPANPIIPDNYHDLLGFKVNGTVYSTGANDALLEAFLGSEIVDAGGNPKSNYVRQRFKAYSTNGVQNTTVSQHHIFTGEFVDGEERETPTQFLTDTDPGFDNIRGLSMFDVLIDGKNGLNLGSGINNLNQSTSIQFFSGNGQFGGVSDGYPDLLIPNMAEAGGTDVYYYTDELGNIIGRPISIRINNSDSNNPPLSHWQNDQYRVTLNVSFDLAKPIQRIYGDRQERPMRLIAFSLDDFGISEDPSANQFWKLQNIFNINAGAGGTADIPFLAYNGDTFAIRSPEVLARPTPRSVCAVPSNIDVLFEVAASVDGGFSTPSDPLEALTFDWFKFNTSLGVSDTGTTTSSYPINGINQSDLGLYRVRISNGYGTTLVTVELEEGGTPAIWDGTKWTYPSGFIAAGGPNPLGNLIPVADADRRLIFSEDFDVNTTDLEGCDCLIPAGRKVEVFSGRSLKLYGEVIMRPETPELDNDGNPIGIIPAGALVIQDDASLIQTKDTDVNDNEGEMIMHREASDLNLYDFIFWSSPVDVFDLENIPNSGRYLWDVRASNPNGSDGNWISYNGVMQPGRGYIARVPSAATFSTTFSGVPNNGLISYNVLKSVGNQALEDKHWNLIGNPYPSAISADKFLNHPDNSRLNGAVYVWNQTIALTNTPNPGDSPYYQNFGYNYADSYITYNKLAAVPDTYDGNIAAGQAFFVQVNDGQPEGSIVFRNTMRYGPGVSKPILPNNQFYRNGNPPVGEEEAEEEKHLIWLSLVNADLMSSTMAIGYAEGATNGKDRLYDANANRSSGEMSLHSLLEGSELVIQGKSLPFDEMDFVKLGVNIPENGVYKIGIDHVKGSIFENEETNIILEDTHLGILHDLREKPYSFTGQVGTFNERFILRYTANQLSTKEVDGGLETFVFIKDKVLNVQSSKVISRVKVYDISGKEIVNIKPEANINKIQRDFNFSRGVYIAIITLEDNIKFSKKVIN